MSQRDHLRDVGGLGRSRWRPVYPRDAQCQVPQGGHGALLHRRITARGHAGLMRRRRSRVSASRSDFASVPLDPISSHTEGSGRRNLTNVQQLTTGGIPKVALDP